MEPRPEPTPEDQDEPLERVNEEDASRYPGHEDPDSLREQVGLDEDRSPEPQGAPPPAEPETGAPTPSSDREQ